MDIVARIKQFIAISGLPTTQFADYAQIPRPTLSQILNGRNRKISNELLAKLHDAFPELNMMWLMFGDGEPELKTNTQISEGKNTRGLFDDVSSSPENQTHTAIASETKEAAATDQSTQDRGKITDGRPQPRQNNELSEPKHSDVDEGDLDAQALLASSFKAKPTRTLAPGSGKKVQTIMVFYDDNSFEIFTPSTQA